MDTIVYLLLFVLGAILGSFYCCMGMRIPNKISLITPGSYCPKCNKTIAWYMNVPILSYICLKGKCAYCKEKIDIICFICEILTPCLFIISYSLFGFGYEFFVSLVLISALTVTIVSDFYYFYISDRVVIISFILITIINYIFLGFTGMLYHLLYSIVMVILMIIFKLLGNYLFKKESLGDGDIKLIAVACAPHSLFLNLFVLMFASILGLICALSFPKNKDNIIPFGPFILLASLIVLYFTNELLVLYNIL